MDAATVGVALSSVQKLHVDHKIEDDKPHAIIETLLLVVFPGLIYNRHEGTLHHEMRDPLSSVQSYV